MIKNYCTHILKCSITVFAMAFAFTTAAQTTTATIGTGTSTTEYLPITACYEYTYAQQIYTAAELTAAGASASAGAITKLRFYYSSGAATNSDNWTIYIGHTSKSTFSSSTDWVAVSSLAHVFSGTVTFPSSAGWLEIPLSTPFVWDGTSNIVVAVDENKPGYYCSTYWRYTSKSNSCLYKYRDYTDVDPAAPPSGSRTGNRPNAQFVFQALCSGTPVAGAAAASPATICLGAATTLSVPAASTGAGISYQWQSSPDNVTYTDISGATSGSYMIIPLAVTWYRCRVTCVSGPLSTISTPVQVSFSYNIATTTNGSRCGIGTVSLSATAASGTLRWYSAASGGSPIGTGSPFSTPGISTTTQYYVAAEGMASGMAAVGSGGTTASGTGSSPFSQAWESNHSQYLVPAGELLAAGFGAGNMTALSLNISSKVSSLPFAGYTIKLAATSATSLSALLTPSFTTVYGPASYSSVAGINNFTFGTPFSWDGSSNILVDICFDNDPTSTGAYYTSNDVVAATTMPYTAAYGMYADNTTLCGATSGGTKVSSSILPVFTFTGNKVCSSPRKAVTATITAAPAFALSGTQTVCNNAVAALNVSSPVTNYTEYHWSPVAGLYTDAAATIPDTTGSSVATVYAKTTAAGSVTYSCNAYNSVSGCAAVSSVTVTTLPDVVTAIATPSSICVSGSTKLALSPAPSGFGAATLQWASSADNTGFADIAGATGNTYTTPTLTTTSYYRTTIRNSAGAVCLNSVSDTALVLNPLVSSVTGASRCGSGSVTLSASPSDGTINWYAAATGGSPLASGSTFTTPSLSATTTYYAEASARSDATITAGTGGATLYESGLTPFSQAWESSHSQYLYLASELTAAGLSAGTLSALSFKVTDKYSESAFEGYTMKMAHTSSTSLSGGLLSPSFTKVYGPVAYTPASGINTLNFGTAFVWDGSSNILLHVCFALDPDGSGGALYTSNDEVEATNKSYTAAYGYYQDNSDLCGTTGWSSSSSTKLPVISFLKQGCRSGRTAVTATINSLPVPTISPSSGPVSICGGATTLSGGGGVGYQWRNTGGPIAGATSSNFTTGSSGDYQVVVTNAAGCKDSSKEITVIVNDKPTVSVLPSETLTMCADSSQKYTGVVSSGLLTYQWYNAGVAIPGATSNTYTAADPGLYSLRVFLASCSDTSNETRLEMNPLPAASFSRTGTTSAICLADSLELTALSVPAGSVYQWLFNGKDIPGATRQQYYAKAGGSYSVRIRNANNCRKVSDEQLIINTPMGIPGLSPKDVLFCAGNTIMLPLSAGQRMRSCCLIAFLQSRQGRPAVMM